MTIAARALAVLAGFAVGAAAPGPAQFWVLRGNGLAHTVAGKTQELLFGKPGTAALATATSVLGKPLRTRTVPDCGQSDPMTLVGYSGGLAIQVLNGTVSGWSLDPPAGARFRTTTGITVGSTRAAPMTAYPDAGIEDGSLGGMFSREDGPSGFLDSMKTGARVIGFHAGETCMIS